MPADPQFITLSSAHPPLRVTALRGQTAPAPTGGFGGWQKVARPLRTSLTQWNGSDPFEQQFSLMLDGVRDDSSIEDACDALEQMATPPSSGAEPPVIRVDGAVLHPEYEWIVSALDWDPSPIWSRRGHRIRQEVTITLTKYIADDVLAQMPAAERKRREATSAAAAAARKAGSSRQAPQSKLYVVKAGDTLSKIAAAVLGSYKRWHELSDLNGIRDPKAITVGQKLRLP